VTVAWTPFAFGLALIVSVSTFLFAIGLRNPRLMLQDYPEDVRRAVPPKTPAERREAVWWIAGLFVLVFGLPLAAAVVARAQQPDLSFPGVYLTAFIVLIAFNLYDLLVVDWLYLCTWTPSFAVLPGTEGMAGYKDYGLHFRGFLFGTGLSVVASGPIAAVAWFVPV
jgi:hypothetical protein